MSTEINKDDIKKITHTLYDQLVDLSDIPNNEFMRTFFNVYHVYIHIIAEEMNIDIYPQREKVITMLIKRNKIRNIYRDYSIGDSKNNFLAKWIAQHFDQFRHIEDNLDLIIIQTDIDLFSEFVTIVCKNHSTLFFKRINQVLEDNIARKDEELGDIIILFKKLIILYKKDTNFEIKNLWKFLLFVIDSHYDFSKNLSIDGFLFNNRKIFGEIKAKYSIRNAFEEKLDKMMDINDAIVQSNLVHYGVEKIIIGYL